VSWLKKLFGSSESVAAPTPSLSGEKVLVADSSTAIQKVLQLTLEEVGCSVVVATSGEEAVMQLAMTRPTVVIAAAGLPGASGYEICEAVRRRPDLEGTAVVITKDFGESLDEGRLKRAGCDDVLSKPFPPGLVIERIAEIRRRRRPEAGPA
jgi:CheY-like chemotaxis protein